MRRQNALLFGKRGSPSRFIYESGTPISSKHKFNSLISAETGDRMCGRNKILPETKQSIKRLKNLVRNKEVLNCCVNVFLSPIWQ